MTLFYFSNTIWVNFFFEKLKKKLSLYGFSSKFEKSCSASLFNMLRPHVCPILELEGCQVFCWWCRPRYERASRKDIAFAVLDYQVLCPTSYFWLTNMAPIRLDCKSNERLWQDYGGECCSCTSFKEKSYMDTAKTSGELSFHFTRSLEFLDFELEMLLGRTWGSWTRIVYQTRLSSRKFRPLGRLPIASPMWKAAWLKLSFLKFYCRKFHRCTKAHLHRARE